jgi:hypothetical protein
MVESLDKLNDHLNSKVEIIKFTMKIEDNNNIPLFDILISKKSDGSLEHQVYCKKTHIDGYLQVESHHHPTKIVGAINIMVTREIKVSNSDHVD